MRSPAKIGLALAAVLLLGAGRSNADTVTFNNLTVPRDGLVTVGQTASFSAGSTETVARSPLAGLSTAGSCGPGGQTNFGCLNLSSGVFDGAIGSSTANDYSSGAGGPIGFTTANDYAYLGAGSSLSTVGGIPALSPGLLNATSAAAVGVSPITLGGQDQTLFTGFTGDFTPAGNLPDGSPTGTDPGNTNQIEVVAPDLTIAAVPEPQTLILLGTGLVVTARFVRRRRQL